MRTILVVEDQFLSAYELEWELKERGFSVAHSATMSDALQKFRSLRASRDLAAIVCDNRLIDGKPAALLLYRAVRASDADVPFIVYSGFPPNDLPQHDPRLMMVNKPFTDRVVFYVEKFAGRRKDVGPDRNREAA